MDKSMMNSNLKLRMATAADASEIADLSRETFYETFAVYNTIENMEKFMNGPFSQELLRAEVGDPDNDFLLVENAEKILGYARMRQAYRPKGLDASKIVEIARIYVSKEAIGRGLGKMLMEACIEKARDRGLEWIWLGVWEHNQRAIEFYTKWGFEKFGEHVFMLGDDEQTDWMMKKKL